MDAYEPVDFSFAQPHCIGDSLANASMLMGWANDYHEMGFEMRGRWAMRQAVKCFEEFWKYRRWADAALTYEQHQEKRDRAEGNLAAAQGVQTP